MLTHRCTRTITLHVPNHYKVVHKVATPNIKIAGGFDYKTIFKVKIDSLYILPVNL